MTMLKIYGPNNRKFLGRDNALFLLLKLTLQNLAQTRLLRVSSTTAFSNIQNKLDTIYFSMDSLAHKNQLLHAIKKTHAMLDNAHKHRLKSIKDYGIKHSTLIEACTRKRNEEYLKETSIKGAKNEEQTESEEMCGTEADTKETIEVILETTEQVNLKVGNQI